MIQLPMITIIAKTVSKFVFFKKLRIKKKTSDKTRRKYKFLQISELPKENFPMCLIRKEIARLNLAFEVSWNVNVSLSQSTMTNNQKDSFISHMFCCYWCHILRNINSAAYKYKSFYFGMSNMAKIVRRYWEIAQIP